MGKFLLNKYSTETYILWTVGPTIGGALWSVSLRDGSEYPFDRHFVYYLIAALSLFTYILSFSLPKSIALGGSMK
jgi:hypothetical protein